MLLRFFFDSKRSNGALIAKMKREYNENKLGCLPLRNEKNSLELELTLN